MESNKNKVLVSYKLIKWHGISRLREEKLSNNGVIYHYQSTVRVQWKEETSFNCFILKEKN